jgi:DNA-binding NtrC family response regulator
VKLLRVLDTSTFRRLGVTAETRIHVRRTAATNRDLEARVRQQLFRDDLFYRLSSITLRLPPLRERREDNDLLVDHVIATQNGRFGSAKRAMRWPAPRRVGPATTAGIAAA